jgi:hypothetical protein
MSNFNRLLGLAQKALDKAGPSNPDARPGQTDWRAVVRNAADALTGEGRGDAGAVRGAGGGAGEHGAATAAAAGAGAGAGAPVAAGPAAGVGGDAADRSAIARYDYLLQTADPHQIEQVHREAFARLTPAQRAQIEERMTVELPAHERPRSSEVDDLARAATRTEVGRPGVLRGLLARAGAGRPRPQGVGGARSGARGLAGGAAVAGAGVAAGGVLAAVAGGAVVSSVAGPLLEQAANIGVDFEALGSAIDLEGIAGGVEGLTGGIEGLTGGVEGLAGGVDGLAAGAGETVSGLGDQVSGLGDRVADLGSGFTLPGLDDLFGR